MASTFTCCILIVNIIIVKVPTVKCLKLNLKKCSHQKSFKHLNHKTNINCYHLYICKFVRMNLLFYKLKDKVFRPKNAYVCLLNDILYYVIFAAKITNNKKDYR